VTQLTQGCKKAAVRAHRNSFAEIAVQHLGPVAHRLAVERRVEFADLALVDHDHFVGAQPRQGAIEVGNAQSQRSAAVRLLAQFQPITPARIPLPGAMRNATPARVR
jgi:hypothetical protein